MITMSEAESYYQRNRERVLAKQREKRSDPTHRARTKAYSREYYRKNRDMIASRARQPCSEYAAVKFSIVHQPVTITFD
jgi:hypothetical protein